MFALVSSIALACATTAGLVGSPCASARPPGRPAPTSGGSDLPTLTFVFSSLEVAVDREPLVGFDLDGTCTRRDAGSSCRLHGHATDVQDDDFGRDNIVPEVLRALPSLLGTGGGSAEQARVLIEVSGWNGLPDDDDVRIEFYVSHRTQTREDGTPAHLPARDSLFAPPQTKSKWIAENAYVRDRVLHAERIPEMRVDFAVPRSPTAAADEPNPYFELVLTDGMLSVPLPEDGQARSGGGVLGGRAATGALLASLSVIDSSSDGGDFLCGTNDIFVNLRDSICEGADIRTFARDDGRTTERCDAISFAFELGLERAALAREIDDTPKAPARCDGAPPPSCPPP